MNKKWDPKDFTPVEEAGESFFDDTKKLFIAFKISREYYALEGSQIKEICNLPEVYPMPMTPPLIKGLSDIRGQIITLLNIFSPEQIPADKQFTNVAVLTGNAGNLGLIVPEDLQSVNLDFSGLSNGVRDAKSFYRNFVKGVVEADDNIYNILSVGKIRNNSREKLLESLKQVKQ